LGSGTLAIIAAFVGLILVIMIHEGGHYLAARGFRFRVLEYFVGFGPRLWSFRRGEIEYGVKAFPVGGYVKIAGMNPLQQDVPPGDEDRAYFAKPVWQRAIVIAAGPLSHFLVAALIFTALYATTGIGRPEQIRAQVAEVTEEIAGQPSPAAAAGLQPGDLFLRIGDVDRPNLADIGAYQAAHPNEPIEYVLDRGGERIEVTMTPTIDVIDGEEVPRVGVVIDQAALPLGAAVAAGFGDIPGYTWESIKGIGRVFGPEGVGRVGRLLFTDEERRVDDAASVVGIGQQVGAAGEVGAWEYVILLFGYVTLFIGIINLIPLPPFDGGHLALLLIETVRGRPVDLKKVIPVSAAVLIFLLTFVLATVILDVTKPIPISP
jgi:membrane-associated protease RseP (regulator of RpoE activity)